MHPGLALFCCVSFGSAPPGPKLPEPPSPAPPQMLPENENVWSESPQRPSRINVHKSYSSSSAFSQQYFIIYIYGEDTSQHALSGHPNLLLAHINLSNAGSFNSSLFSSSSSSSSSTPRQMCFRIWRLLLNERWQILHSSPNVPHWFSPSRRRQNGVSQRAECGKHNLCSMLH